MKNKAAKKETHLEENIPNEIERKTIACYEEESNLRLLSKKNRQIHGGGVTFKK